MTCDQRNTYLYSQLVRFIKLLANTNFHMTNRMTASRCGTMPNWDTGAVARAVTQNQHRNYRDYVAAV